MTPGSSGNRLCLWLVVAACATFLHLPHAQSAITSNGDWSAMGDLPGSDGTIYAMVRDPVSGVIYVGGQFRVIGGVAAENVAKWNGTTWTNLAEGIPWFSQRVVYALELDSAGNLYAGGTFPIAGNRSASNVARWNGTTWTNLGDGINGTVYALKWGGGNLYAGGTFVTASGYSANRIARWNGTVWTNLGTGISSPNAGVYALEWDTAASKLFVGGSFFTAGGVSARNVASWNGTAWTNLGSGTDSSGFVQALESDGTGNLYAGGLIASAGGQVVRNVARWNGTSWAGLGTVGGSGDTVYSLLWSGGQLYAGGTFISADSITVNRITRWDGNSWQKLDAGINNLSILGAAYVYALAPDGAGGLYIGGFNCRQAAGKAIRNLARWNGTAWQALGSGLDGGVMAMAADNQAQIYAGGYFSGSGGKTNQRFIARWTGNNWTNVGLGMNHQVWALAWEPTSASLYAGGTFTLAGGSPANRVARWDGAAWTNLGAGLDGEVRAVVTQGSNVLYAGGSFSNAGGSAASNIAKWNGLSWTNLSSGLDNAAYSLAVDPDGILYAGGNFTNAGGLPASRVARWDGTFWTSLGVGFPGDVAALAVDGSGNLYAGGAFYSSGGNSNAYNIALWDGQAWTNLGSGLNALVTSLFLDEAGTLYAMGIFQGLQPDGLSANRIARWDGTSWSSLASGLGSQRSAFTMGAALGASNRLYVGGDFLSAGQKVTANAAHVRIEVRALRMLGTNGIIIPRGDRTPRPADGTDFGQVAVQGGLVSRTFGVTNSSTNAIAVTGVSMSGPEAAEFEVLSYSTLIPARGQGEVTVRFDPADEDTRTATLTLLHDADEQAYPITIRGAGTLPLEFRPGRLTLRQAQVLHPENNPLLFLTVERTNGSYGAVSVNYATTNGTATSGVDYVASTGALFFASGQTEATLALSMLDDTALEGEELFAVKLQEPQGGAKLGGLTSTVVRITDNDVPGVLSLVVTNVVVDEDAGPAVLRVERSGGAAGSVSVAYTTVVGTAAAGADYTTTHGTLTFGPEEFNASIPVPIFNDATGESVERFTLRIRNPTGGATLGSITQAVVEIQDDDRSIFMLAARQPVPEGVAGGQVTLEVRRSGDLSSTARVDYAVTPGTAQANLDYTPTAGALTFAVGISNVSITVAIVDDTVVGEPVETFTVQLSNPSEGYSLGGIASTVVEIEDNDRVLLNENFNAGQLPPGWQVKANRHPSNLWRFDNPGQRGNYTGGSGGMAIADSDYLGWCFFCSSYRGMDTELISPVLNFSGMNLVTLSYRNQFFTRRANICDVDVSLNGTQGPWINVLRRTGNVYHPDYQILDLSNWLAGQSSATIRFRFYNAWADGWWQIDDVVVNGRAMNPSSFGVLSLAARSAPVAEGARQYVVDVLRSGGSQVAASALLTIEPVSATAGSDYASPGSVPLFFYPGMQALSHRVTILDDALNEGPESFRAVLSAPGGGAVLGLVQTNVVTILDDEGLLADLKVAAEGLPAVIRQGSNLAFRVTAQNLGPSTASTAVAQYQLPPSAVLVTTSLSRGIATNQAGVLRWNIGSLNPFETATADLVARFQAMSEVTNRFDVDGDEADGDPLNNAVAVTSQVRSAGALQFASPVFSANERAGVLAVDVLRVGGSLGAAAVTVATVADSALAGSDYQPVNRVVNFADGETVQTVDLALVDDAVVEGTELLYLQLSGAEGAGLASPWAAVSLQDDDILSVLGAEGFNAPPPAPSGLAGLPSAGVWRVVTNAGPAGWRFDDPGSRGNQTGGGGGFAVADSEAAGAVPMDTELISPVYSFANSLGAALEFKTDLVTTQGLGEVRVSLNGLAGPWTVVWDSRGQSWPGPFTNAVALGEAVAGQTNVMIGFRYYQATNDGWWAVDDVKVYGEQDADLDQLPDWWEVLNFGGVGAQAATNDYDQDGADNLHEYGADTSPTNDLSNPGVVRLVWSNGLSRVSFVGSPNRRYDVEGSGQVTGPWQVLESGVIGAGGLQEAPVAGGDTNSFYRLHIRGF